MNTPVAERNGDAELRYGEYVLGVLDADERAAVAREVAASAEAAAAVLRWELKLLPLTELVPEVAPAPHVWTQIASATQASQPSDARLRRRGTLSRWRALAIGASALAAGLLVFVLLRIAPVAVSPAYLASAIEASNGSVIWTATLDRGHGRLIVVPGTATPLPPSRAPELWVIPANAKPVALGMIVPDRPITLILNGSLLAQVGPTAKLAISIEPPGGSPTGQPTGAIIGVGAIRQVPGS